MTVKCFTAQEKKAVIDQYNRKAFPTLKELAANWGASTRTIGRILEEAGLATPVPRIQGEAYQIMQVLKAFKITTAQQLKDFLKHELSLDTPKPAQASMPPNEAAVQAYLASCDKTQLIELFYQAGLHRLGPQAKAGIPTHATPNPSQADDAFIVAA